MKLFISVTSLSFLFFAIKLGEINPQVICLIAEGAKEKILVLWEVFQFHILDDILAQEVIWLLLLKNVFFNTPYLSYLRRN
jgi:hypothetical protein